MVKKRHSAGSSGLEHTHKNSGQQGRMLAELLFVYKKTPKGQLTVSTHDSTQVNWLCSNVLFKHRRDQVLKRIWQVFAFYLKLRQSYHAKLICTEPCEICLVFYSFPIFFLFSILFLTFYTYFTSRNSLIKWMNKMQTIKSLISS